MQRRAGTDERVIQGEGAGEEPGERLPHFPGRTARAKKKRLRRPEPLGADAKNFNDEIPDPDGDTTVPE